MDTDHNTRIKDIYIELPKYQFYHSPYNPQDDDIRFIGRKRLIDKLKSIIEKTKTASGAYLITGIRGMGKSSFIKSVFEEYAGPELRLDRNRLPMRYFLYMYLLVVFACCLMSLTKLAGSNVFAYNVLSVKIVLQIISLILYTSFIMQASARYKQSPDFCNDNLKPINETKNVLTKTEIPVIKIMNELWIGLGIKAYLQTNFQKVNTNIYIALSFLNFILYELNLTGGLIIAVICINVVILLYSYTRIYDSLYPNRGYKPTTTIDDKTNISFIFAVGFLFYSFSLSYVPSSIKKLDMFDLALLQVYAIFIMLLCVVSINFLGFYTRVHYEKYKNGTIRPLFRVIQNRYFHKVKNDAVLVDISVGYDFINERDIFVLITKGIKEKIKSYIVNKRFSFPWMIWLILIVITYHLPFAITARREIYSKYGLVSVFPSQSVETKHLDLNMKYNDYYHTYKAYIHKYLNRILDLPIKYTLEARAIVSSDSKYSEAIDTIIKSVSFPGIKRKLDNKNDRSVSINGSVHISDEGYLPGNIIIRILGIENCKTISSADIYFSSILTYYLGRMIITFPRYIRVLFYPLFNYSFYLHCLMMLLLIGLGKITIGFRLRHYDSLYKSIQELETRLYATYSSTRGIDLPGQLNTYNLFRSRQTKLDHPIPSAKEIEQELIDIFHVIREKHEQGKLPQFMILIDEIDKIEAFSNKTLAEIEEETAEQLNSKPHLTTVAEQTRKKRYSIFSLLSNLKHFFTTAETKFFFVAGKEIYDASLADVSDRDFFLRSIFNEVINVESFYSDLSDNNPNSITTMTESYLCQFLLPRSYLHKMYKADPKPLLYDYLTIKEYVKYLKTEISIDETDPRLDKIIGLLQHYVIYLAYRSNGAPKRISSLFEELIVPLPNIIDEGKTMVIGISSNNLYLHFGFYKQYAIEFTNYLVGPLFLPSNASVQDFGDKLLVDTSFIYDHILKFHKTGFSWQDLEFMPEFLDINKAPELRDMMQRVLTYLQKSHIESIQNGIYNFVFNKRIVEEIRFLSKVSEQDAAALNFTLDESFIMKRHHYQKLKLLSSQRVINTNTDMQIDNSEMFTHLLLGDLHFNDEEYEEALIQYRQAIQPIRYQVIPQSEITLFITYLKCMLKIGLTYEKMHNFDNALAYYEKASVDVIRFRDINLHKMNLVEVQIKKLNDGDPNTPAFEKLIDSMKDKDNVKFMFDDVKQRLMLKIKGGYKSLQKEVTHRLIIRKDPYELKWYEEKETPDIELPLIKAGDNVIERSNNFWHLLIRTEFTPLKEEHLSKIAVFENVRILIQPFIAKLHVLEKAYHGGFVLSDLNRVENEFEFIKKILRKKEEWFIQSEFWKKIGDLVFFKNPTFSNSIQKKDVKDEIENSIKFQNLRHFSPFRKYMIENNDTNKCVCGFFHDSTNNTLINKRNCYACSIYMYNLESMHQFMQNNEYAETGQTSAFQKEFVDICKDILYNMDYPFYDYLTPIQWTDIAKSLSALSDCLLSCYTAEKSTKSSQESKEINNLITLIMDCYFAHDPIIQEETTSSHPFYSRILFKALEKFKDNNSITLAIIGYLTTIILYRHTGFYRYENDVIKKMVYLFYTFHSYIPGYRYKKINYFLVKLINNGIQAIYHSYDSIHRSEIGRKRDILLKGPYAKQDFVSLTSLSIYPEINELIVIYEGYRLKYYADKNYQDVIEMISQFEVFVKQINPCSFINLMSIRVLNLNFKSKVLYLIYDKIKDIKRIDLEAELRKKLNSIGIKTEENGKELVIDDILFNIMKEGLHCMHSIIKYLHIQGISYITNHSYHASAYYHMGLWCNEFIEFLNTHSTRKKFENYRPATHEEIPIISPIYYFAKAREHYKLALDVINGGEAYQKITRNMYFLNEDFNSDMYHFFHALEIAILRQAKTSERYRKVKMKDQGSTVYDKVRYFNPLKGSDDSEYYKYYNCVFNPS